MVKLPCTKYISLSFSLWMAGPFVWMRLERVAAAAPEVADTEVAAVVVEEEEVVDTSVEAEEEVS